MFRNLYIVTCFYARPAPPDDFSGHGLRGVNAVFR